MTKDEIILGIHALVSNNVIGEKQLMSRYKGFKGELYYDNYHKLNFPQLMLLQGGTIVSIDNHTSSLNNAFYYTLISKIEAAANVGDYEVIYKRLSKIGFVKMFLIIYPDEPQSYINSPVMKYDSGNISVPVPEMEILLFNSDTSFFETTNNSLYQITNMLKYHEQRRKNKYPIPTSCRKWMIDNLSQFSEDQLLQIYMDRLFLDGFIGFAADKGKISDIDLITKKGDEYRLIEVKEKDLPKRAKRGFGLDVPRILDLAKISKSSNLQYFLVVRHINNQTERKLVGWKYISIKEFIADARKDEIVEGGTGMRSAYSNNPTLICSYDLFKDL